jgi:hypothetical protein
MLPIKNLLLIVLLWSTLLSCQSAPEPFVRASWADVTLTAVGFSPIQTWSPEERLRGVQLAKIDAARQLQEKILALMTDSGKPFSATVHKENKMNTLSAYVRGAEVTAVLNNPQGIEIHTRLPLGDPFKAAMGLLKRKDIPAPNHPDGREGAH